QPDLQIRTSAETTYTGVGVYSAGGANQVSAQSVAARKTAVYYVRLQNAGNVSDSFKLKGTAGNADWKVLFQDVTGAADVTGQMTGSGWLAPPLAPGAIRLLKVLATPLATAPTGSSRVIVVQAASVTNPLAVDAVRAVTTVAAATAA